MSDRLAESTAQGLVGTDEEGRITLFSDAVERLLGHRRDAVLGRPYDEVLVPARLRDATRSGLRGLVGGGAAELAGRAVRVPALTAEGEERVVAMTVLEAGAPPTRFIACVSAEAEDAALSSGPMSLVGLFTVHGPTGRIEMSRKLREMHRLREGEVPLTIGDYVDRVIHPDDRARARRRLLDRQEGRPVTELHAWRVVTPDGDVRHLLSEGSTISADDGSFERVIGVIRDVSETEGTRRALLAHRTLNRALDAWNDPRGGVAGVLRALVTEMGWSSGAMWKAVDGTDRLHRQVFWRRPDGEGIESPDGAGSAGEDVIAQAWSLGDVVTSPADGVRRDGPPEVAIPVIVDGRPLAVLHFRGTTGQVPSPEMREALTEIGRGRLAEYFARHRAELGLSPLTDREQQVLQLAADGGAISAIAAQLGISPSTVKTHFEHIYDKLGVSDRGGAVAEGFRRGLVS